VETESEPQQCDLKPNQSLPNLRVRKYRLISYWSKKKLNTISTGEVESALTTVKQVTDELNIAIMDNECGTTKLLCITLTGCNRFLSAIQPVVPRFLTISEYFLTHLSNPLHGMKEVVA